MFLTDPQGTPERGREESSPSTITKLSQAIRVGSEMIPEGRYMYYRDKCACALGAALAATGYHDPDSNYARHEDAYRHLARFGVPVNLMRDASIAHYRGAMNRTQVADWLEAQGY